jgi:hypothetical protein
LFYKNLLYIIDNYLLKTKFMKRKVYFLLMLTVCLSIATPALAAGPLHDTVDLVGDPYPNDHGSCTQVYTVTSHFLWIPYNEQTYKIDVPCVQVYQGYVD